MNVRNIKDKVSPFISIKNSIATFSALVVFAGIVWGAQSYFIKTYALAEDLKETKQQLNKINKRLDWKILKDKLDDAQERLWKWEDRYEKKVMPEEIKQEYRQLQQEKTQIIEDLEELKK